MPQSLTPITPAVRVLGDDRVYLTARVKEAYLAGESMREIGEQLNRSYGFVSKLLDEAEVERRPRGGYHNARS